MTRKTETDPSFFQIICHVFQYRIKVMIMECNDTIKKKNQDTTKFIMPIGVSFISLQTYFIYGNALISCTSLYMYHVEVMQTTPGINAYL